MNAGYIYILINNSLNGLIKIGSTTLGAKERAKQLSSHTGVPTPFIVAYEIYVEECTNFEKTIQNELSEFRINQNREFFQYPLNKAIELICKLNERQNTNFFEAIEIMTRIIERYGNNIDASISSMRICQDEERVYFEFTRDKYIANYLKNQTITRTDLGFIVEGYEEKMFNSQEHINTNVSKFLELDDWSIYNCIGEIFIEEWSPNIK